jgi:hypothetical protein
MSKAIITCVAGVYWLSDGNVKIRVPNENATSRQALAEWAESYDEVVYNFAANLLPELEPATIPPPSLSATNVLDNVAAKLNHRAHHAAETKGASAQIRARNYANRAAERPIKEPRACVSCGRSFVPRKPTASACGRGCANRARAAAKRIQSSNTIQSKDKAK